MTSDEETGQPDLEDEVVAGDEEVVPDLNRIDR